MERAPRRISDQPALRVGQDDNDLFRPLATIIAAAEASSPKISEVSSTRAGEMEFQPLSGVRPTRKRTLYLSEKLVNPSNRVTILLYMLVGTVALRA